MSKQSSQSGTLPDYKKPPVTEVVCGIVFERIHALKAPHFGLFWQRVHGDYPTCEHALPLGFPPKATEPTMELDLALPRIWLISEKKNELIQLQTDRFYYNWRKMHEMEVYPRYQSIVDGFRTNFEIFENFLKDEALGSPKPIECELTYINHIPKGEGWSAVADIHDLLPDLDWRSDKKRFLPKPHHLGWQATFHLPEDMGRLQVKLDQALRKIDNLPLFVLEISARGLGADKSRKAIWDWFELAHTWIVCGFSDLTGTTIQKTIWEREDDFRKA
jgi:uncharacterized protein (TIGR04255 family)